MTVVAPNATARAHWLAHNLLAWPFAPAAPTYRLHATPHGGLALTASDAGDAIFAVNLHLSGLPAGARTQHPHLAHAPAFRAVLTRAQAALALRGQCVLAAWGAHDELLDYTNLQIPGVLDDLYPYHGPLGTTFAAGVPTLRVWAPTAQTVHLVLYPGPDAPALAAPLPMTRDDATGVWHITGTPAWYGHYYHYAVTVFVPATGQVERNLVTDPYSVTLAANSTRSQVVNLTDPAFMPAGWEVHTRPPLARIEDSVLYELHVRDFSMSDARVPAAWRGKYLAFTVPDSHGMTHLRSLAAAGLTHVHLLPIADMATVNELESTRTEPDTAHLLTLPPDSTAQQAIILAHKERDGFNWGYDPYHYAAPEGSYATDPHGPARIRECRAMIQALHAAGLRVVLDVVYNHTHAGGQHPSAVLDRIVPGYYHRLDAFGHIEHSTCCANTASEHAQMEKLLLDTLDLWHNAYAVDGFRFDLMGHHMRTTLTTARTRLPADVLLYGEGWDFGEVAHNARGINATQFNLHGTGIGTFNDRLRDAARGGRPFSGLRDQGFATGLYLQPNATPQGPRTTQRAHLLHYTDQLRVALAGNLHDYRFTNATGHTLHGAELSYGGAPTGYCATPREHIAYVGAHDNETLFDALQLKAAATTTLAARVRMHMLALSLVACAQGIPFFHAGDELLRSKSLDRNSYDSGDWFNALDFSGATDAWGRGLPPAPDNATHWPVLAPLLADPALHPTPAQRALVAAHFRELLAIRTSSPLFRLATAAEVRTHVHFLNTGPRQRPGLLVLWLVGQDTPHPDVLVAFNAAPYTQTWRHPALRERQFALHPVQVASADPIVRTARHAHRRGLLRVPALTTAVFVATPSPAG